jgi:hypothetical protein
MKKPKGVRPSEEGRQRTRATPAAAFKDILCV